MSYIHGVTTSHLLTNLIDTAKLEVTGEVLFVKSLHPWVEEAAEERALDLLHDFCAGLLSVVLCYDGAKAVVVKVKFFRELVGGAFEEVKFVGRYAQGLEYGKEDKLVIFCAMSDQL